MVREILLMHPKISQQSICLLFPKVAYSTEFVILFVRVVRSAFATVRVMFRVVL